MSNVLKSENVEEVLAKVNENLNTDETETGTQIPGTLGVVKLKEKTENKKNEELAKLAERLNTKFDKAIVANIPVSEETWKLVHSYFRHGKDGGKTENPVTVLFGDKEEKCENANEFLSFTLHNFINTNIEAMKTAFDNREEVSKRDSLAKIASVEDADTELAKLLAKVAAIQAKRETLV